MSVSCLACDGDVWVTVSAGYAEKQIPDPTVAHLEALTEDGQKALWANVYAKRELMSRSVVPCKVCQPDLYWRWKGGHLDSKHNVQACDECTPARPRREAPAQIERKDWD